MSDQSLLYLSEADVARVALDPAIARSAVAAIFAAHHAKGTMVKPKLSLDVGPGHSFQTLCAASAGENLAVNKWVGVAPVDQGMTGAGIHAMIALNDFESGRLLAVLDGNLLTAIRTAAMSAVAAVHLARKDSRSIGFIGCGLQARSHLAAFHALLPGLSNVAAVSRSHRSAVALAEQAKALGMEAVAGEDPRELVATSDIVITSVPNRAGFAPFLDPSWLLPGSFVSAVDVGRSWIPSGLHDLDILATDDQSQAPELVRALGLGDAPLFDADLSALVAGVHPGRTDPRQRTMFIFRGFALGDLAVAARVYAAAKAAGIGTILPR